MAVLTRSFAICPLMAILLHDLLHWTLPLWWVADSVTVMAQAFETVKFLNGI
jgi:hypothetical protein